MAHQIRGKTSLTGITEVEVEAVLEQSWSSPGAVQTNFHSRTGDAHDWIYGDKKLVLLVRKSISPFFNFFLLLLFYYYYSQLLFFSNTISPFLKLFQLFLKKINSKENQPQISPYPDPPKNHVISSNSRDPFHRTTYHLRFSSAGYHV